jgi:Xaa-Pro aminopeptidase
MLSGVATHLLGDLEPDVTERELAARIDWELKRAGFDRPAFDTIVAAGANGALPHAQPTARRIRAGDLVVLDFGGVYDGYCVDLTRTVCFGEPDSEMRRVYDAVAQAQDAAIAAVKPGVRASEIDAAARDTLSGHRLGEAFGHSTGHGLGIEVHEEPRVSKRREPSSGQDARSEDRRPAAGPSANPDAIIQAGMVFTIEPGAYLPKWGGVRLEDDVLVTSSGAEVLTAVPRELRAR